MNRRTKQGKDVLAEEPGDRDTREWSGGEFLNPSSPNSVPREIVQRQFLELARRLYNVTTDLRDTVLPHLLEVDAAFDEERANTALKKWADKYRLGRTWALRQASETLRLWTLLPDFARLNDDSPPWHPLFHILMRRPRPASTAPFVFNFVCPTFEITLEGVQNRVEPAGWDVELDQREDFVVEARKQFDGALASYWLEQECSALARGLVRVKRSRRRAISLSAKMRWAVQRHCGKMPFNIIASDHIEQTSENVDDSTIIKSINEILRLIELDDPAL